VDTLRDFPNVANVTHLTDHEYSYRLRVGRFRVLFTIETVATIVQIEEVKKRNEGTY
jgi:mRNA-degrading endonuclease RelE of RelBE toxin-antitoxin system